MRARRWRFEDASGEVRNCDRLAYRNALHSAPKGPLTNSQGSRPLGCGRTSLQPKPPDQPHYNNNYYRVSLAAVTIIIIIFIIFVVARTLRLLVYFALLDSSL